MAKVSRRVYGWKSDVPDQRDIRYSGVYKIPKKLTPKADLRPLCSVVEDQGNWGTCTAHALTGALEVLEIKNGLQAAQMSRFFVYYNELVMEGSVNADDGAMLRDGIKSLVKEGHARYENSPISSISLKRNQMSHIVRMV